MHFGANKESIELDQKVYVEIFISDMFEELYMKISWLHDHVLRMYHAILYQYSAGIMIYIMSVVWGEWRIFTNGKFCILIIE